ncbi:MAG: sensor histidine kinase [Thaumarchaeota archaeon]|jgi:signal transduction histidine kinase|nr:sensor histidine kinase [Nitrososphaerota archaeon]MBT5842982.1 sensor histidine kinase [Nitrososphaerota archaeon]MBT6468813.1 sensor histidine kinase [Nitrososphaerota archaeon]
MNIREQLIFFFSLVIIFSVGLSAFFAISYTESGVITAEFAKMETHNSEIMHDIETLHQRASEDLVFTLKNPLFVEYFELPETKAGNNYDENGVLQFTPKQQEIKKDLEQWVYHFQNKFQVDETCVIDFTGQEHARLVLSKIETNENLSPDEETSPFFEPSFMKQKDEVHVQYPYVSPDTNRWVFAYTSPVELGSGQKPAIYHFEIPMTTFSDLLDVHVDDGRVYVLDPQGFVVADSANPISDTVLSIDPVSHFPPFQSVFADGNSEILNKMNSNDVGSGTYVVNGVEHVFVYEHLSTFDWILVHDKSVSSILVGNTTVENLIFTIGIVATTVSIIGVFSVIIISSRITRPIIQLANEISSENPERLESISTTNHETAQITHSVNDLIKKMNDYQEEIHVKNQELTIQKSQLEKLAKVGELASKLTHNLRTPLTVIKVAADLLQLQNKDTLDKRSIEKLERIQSASTNLEKQIESVLTYVREKPLELVETKITDLIADTLQNMDLPNTLSINSKNTENYIQCDADKLQVVLMNIISNASDALKENGVITIDSDTSNHDVQIHVSDDGPGIPSENLSKIFDSLFTTKSTGTGLGLPYCKSVIEQHGGSLSVSQNPTTFTISLPKKTISKKTE